MGKLGSMEALEDALIGWQAAGLLQERVNPSRYVRAQTRHTARRPADWCTRGYTCTMVCLLTEDQLQGDG